MKTLDDSSSPLDPARLPRVSVLVTFFNAEPYLAEAIESVLAQNTSHLPKARAASWGENFLPPLVPPGQSCGLLQRGTLLNWFLQDESLVPCICAVMVCRAAALLVGGFEAEFRGLFDDQVFHAKISEAFPIFALDDCVARYRQHQHSCCAMGRLLSHTQQEANSAFRSWLSSYQNPSDPLPAEDLA